MQESYDKGVANHVDPELCVASRKAGCEALVGVRAGRVLSAESTLTGVPTQSPCAEGHILSIDSARWTGEPTASKTLRMHGNASHANREIPGFSSDRVGKALERSGKSEDARR